MVAAGSYTRCNALLGMTLLIVCFVAYVETINMTAEAGQTVSLPCQAPDKDPVKVVEWDRTDLKTGGHVFLYRDKKCDPNYQHSSFKDRVNLPEGWKMNGDVSLTVKNVTTNDSGTYECHVQTGDINIKVSSINLNVVPPGDKDGGDKDGGDNSGGDKSGGDKDGGDKDGGDEDGGAKSRRTKSGGDKSGSLIALIVCLSVVAVVAVIVVLMIRRHCQQLLIRRNRQQHQDPPSPPPDVIEIHDV